MQNQSDRFNRILQIFQDKLESGTWLPGQKLPTLSAMAKEYEVSVATIREALRVLQSQGFISIEQGRGTFVKQNTPNTATIEKFTIMDLIHLLEVRSLIEPAFAESAAKQAFEEEIKAISESAERMAALASQNESTVKEDMHFHLLVAKATHNDIWIGIYENLQGKLRLARNHTTIPGMIEKAVNYHRRIAKAIEERNPEKAKMLMASHMEATQEFAFYRFKDMNTI